VCPNTELEARARAPSPARQSFQPSLAAYVPKQLVSYSTYICTYMRRMGHGLMSAHTQVRSYSRRRVYVLYVM